VSCANIRSGARDDRVVKKKGDKKSADGMELDQGADGEEGEGRELNWFGLRSSSLQRALVIISVPNVAIAFDPAANHRKPMRAVPKEESSKCRDGILKETQRKENRRQSAKRSGSRPETFA